jgi:23S rRNA pseudouridine2605 synthase
MAHEDDASADAGEGQAGEAPSGERIAKVLARAGVASRREVERLIEAGRVFLNGERLASPAVKVGPADRVTLDGRPIAAAEPTRLFRYHKPPGLVTSHRDPQGRPSVFDALPKGLPRVISVGRLDLNSEGLLLLTNDGELARRLELPSSGLERRYRARAHGHVDAAKLARLAKGITVAGVRYGPIHAELEPGHDSTSNHWLVVTLAEGKNREVRKVLEAIGLTVNRLIRVAYGPYQLGALERGDAEEVAPPGAVLLGARKPLKARPRAAEAAAPAVAPASWAKAKPPPKSHPNTPASKIRRPGSAPARAPTAGPRGPTPSAAPGRNSPARRPGPRPKGGPKRRG